jgi:protein glucosyltransferase
MAGPRVLTVVVLTCCALLLLSSQLASLRGCPEAAIRASTFGGSGAVVEPPRAAAAPPAADAVPRPALPADVLPAPGVDVLAPFNWDEVVGWRLATWDRGWIDARVQQYDLTDLEELCEVGTGLIFCTRIQLIGGRLYVKDLRALELDRDYAVSRVAPFIDLLKFDRSLPDVDIFLALNDQPSVAWSFRGAQGLAHAQGRPPPMFGSTMHPRRADIVWPDYSFWLPTRPHKTRTPPWDQIRTQVLAAGRAVAWEARSELAFFAGDTRHPVRRNMVKVASAAEHADLFAIRTVWIHRAVKTCADAPELDDGGAGVREPGCRYSPPDYCRYKYLLNLGSGGAYANKFKYMLLCGSAVIHVADNNGNQEFWQSQLVPGVHFLQVATAAEVPALLRRLRADPAAEAHARRVGAAGAARMGALSLAEVMTYCAKLLRGYAARQAFVPRPAEGAFEVNCVDDLWRHYDKDSRAPWFRHMLTEDNATCIRTPTPPFAPPAFGGAYRGTRVPCRAANNEQLRVVRCSPHANLTAERRAYLQRCYTDSCAEPCRVDASGKLALPPAG